MHVEKQCSSPLKVLIISNGIHLKIKICIETTTGSACMILIVTYCQRHFKRQLVMSSKWRRT